jgi:sortase (surface protein transpeptidase)
VKKSLDKGAVGRWSIPDVKVNVAVYASTESAKENNAIVDAKDSAIYMKKGLGHLIGDHNYQGFNAIKQCKVGTIAYLDTGDGVKKYICTRVFLGYNEKYYLADENHVEYKMAVGIIANYTCNDTKGSITIVEFAAVEQAKASGSAGR